MYMGLSNFLFITGSSELDVQNSIIGYVFQDKVKICNLCIMTWGMRIKRIFSETKIGYKYRQ